MQGDRQAVDLPILPEMLQWLVPDQGADGRPATPEMRIRKEARPMTIEDLAKKMEERFDKTDSKLDTVNTTVALHSQAIANHDREMKNNHEEHKDIDHRLDHVEHWMWATLGAGVASGMGLAKLFM
jgi:hypothetical protein